MAIKDSDIAFQLRIPRELDAQIAERMGRVGETSRNAWITRALSWAVKQEPKPVAAKSVQT